MEQYIQFIIRHWLLSVSLLVIVLALIFEEVRGKLGESKGLTPEALAVLLSHDEAVAIDIREAAAFHKEHILSSINIPLSENIADPIKKMNLGNKQIILVENTGNVLPIIKKLKLSGFEKVNFLSGGISAWKIANLPLTHK